MNNPYTFKTTLSTVDTIELIKALAEVIKAFQGKEDVVEETQVYERIIYLTDSLIPEIHKHDQEED